MKEKDKHKDKHHAHLFNNKKMLKELINDIMINKGEPKDFKKNKNEGVK